MRLPGRIPCAARGVRLSVWDVFTGCGRRRPLELPAPGRMLQGQSCPQAQSYRRQSKSDAALPPLSCVGGKMTGQDIVPSGHSQLTAINDTTHGGGGGEKVWFCLFSAFTLWGFDFSNNYLHCVLLLQEPKGGFLKNWFKLNMSSVSIFSRNRSLFY